MRTLFSENPFDEKTEVEIFRMADAMIDVMGAESVSDMLLPYISNRESELRAKYPEDHPMFLALEQYRERVRLGLREPLAGVN